MQRTLRACREQGLIADVVEHWNPYVKRPGGVPGVRQDLFGIIDVLALDPQRGVVGIQCTTGGCMPEHRRKLLGTHAQMTRYWLMTPGAVLELWGWRKIKKKSAYGGYTRQKVWEPRIEIVTLEMLDEYVGACEQRAV